MRKHIGLSTLALATAMLATGALGQSLSAGGVNVDLGGGDSGASVSTGGDSSVGSGASSGANDSAVSVDLGGNSDEDGPLGLNLFGSGASDTDVSGDGNGTGTGVLGTDGDVNLSLFGDGTTDASVGLDNDSAVSADLLDDTNADGLGIEGLLSEDGVNDEAVLLDLFGDENGTGVATLGSDPTVDLSGSDTDPNDVTATIGSGEDPNDVTLDVLGGQNGIVDAAGMTRGVDGTVDLSGSGDDPNDVAATLNGDSGNPSDVVVDLFGSDDATDLSGDNVALDLSGGGDDPNDVNGTVGTDGDPATVTADLFGNGADNSGGGSADGGLPIGDLLGGGNPVDTALVPSVGTGGLPALDGNGVAIDLGGATETSSNGGVGTGTNPGTGGIGAGGSGGSDANGVASNDGADPSVGGSNNGGSMAVVPNGGAQAAPLPAVRIAAVNADADSKCFTPNEAQIDYLLGKHKYDASMSNTWSSTDDVNLVPVRLCPEARVRVEQVVEADKGIQWMQDWAAADSRIDKKLDAAGLDADHILALETKNDNLAVYVY
jgi:hypothetical protein